MGTEPDRRQGLQPLGSEEASSAEHLHGAVVSAGEPAFRFHFPWALGEPQVSGTDFSKRAEKGPTGFI